MNVSISYSVVLTTLLTAGTLLAQNTGLVTPMLGAGTHQASIAGNIDDNGTDLRVSLNAQGGYFIADCVEVGAYAGFGFTGDNSKSGSAGVFGEYNFDIGTLLVPYAGVGLGWRGLDTRFNDESFIESSIWGGARFFFVNHAAVGCDLLLKMASDNVYNDGNDATDWELRIGTSWYF